MITTEQPLFCPECGRRLIIKKALLYGYVKLLCPRAEYNFPNFVREALGMGGTEGHYDQLIHTPADAINYDPITGKKK